MRPLDWLDGALAELEKHNLRRRLLAPHGVDLSSNDYLGLATHPEVRAAMVQALQEGLPTGAAGSRLLSGQHPAWTAWEEEFAAWQGAPAALMFGSGFAANVGVVTALVGHGDLVVSDALNHASLIDGVRLSGAERVIVPHNDPDAVARALARPGWRRALVVVESVYSMDGDEADLVALVDICGRHGAMLVVDEAHATGLYGANGQGRVVEHGLREVVTATVHPCGKALGAAGGVVCGSSPLVDWLIQRARPFVFSTALPPCMARGLQAALRVIVRSPELRQRPRELGARLRAALPGRTGTSSSHIVPVITGEATSALHLQSWLADHGWHARAIRPPTVPERASRVRLVMRAALTEAEVDRLGAHVCAEAR